MLSSPTLAQAQPAATDPEADRAAALADPSTPQVESSVEPTGSG